jgi:hypothetical protein
MFLHISELEAASIDPATIKKGQRIVYEAITFNGKPRAKGQQCQAYRRACVGFWRPLGRAGLLARP